MQVCSRCGRQFPRAIVIDGVRRNFLGRKRCLECVPYRALREPRKGVQRAIRVRDCDACGAPFTLRQVIDGRMRFLYRRRCCLACSPFGSHNTSRVPPRIGVPEELREHRRRRRNATTYRYQRKHRKQIKSELIHARGGCCDRCGYNVALAALEFHHRDPATKEFGIADFTGSRKRLLAEVEKCDLLCANCHRIRHVEATMIALGRAGLVRRDRKARAVAYMGGVCSGCGGDGPPGLFEFHHRNAADKTFGISEDGIARSWDRTMAELAKCVMLCANCHREVHAGVREIDARLGLAEDSASYRVSAA